jgi:SAM-dependent methyltransferase
LSSKAFSVLRGEKVETTSSQIEAFLSDYDYRVLDIGAGDGKGSLRYARANQDKGVISLDLAWDALDKTSSNAAKKFDRGGSKNILFLCANAFEISDHIIEQIDLMRIYLPWGDLLEGLAENNEKLLTSLTSTLREGAEYEIVINSEIWKENLPKHLEHLGEITPEFFITNNSVLENFGYSLKETRYLNVDEIKELDTTWSAKLMSSRTNANFVMAKAVFHKID